MADPHIPLNEFAARRKRLRSRLKKSLGLVFAGEHASPLHEDFRPLPHFEYLTGIVDEPAAVLLLDPTHPVEARREVLFLKPLDPEVEKWDGYRDEISSSLRAEYGLSTIHRLGHLPRVLQDAARRSGSLACLHGLARIDQPLSPDMEVFRRLAERMPGVTIEDRSDEIPRLRSTKSAAEVRMIRRAIEITRMGFLATMGAARAGRNERDLQETLEHTYRINGSTGPAFGTIVGAGLNSTVLHYRANDASIEAGDVINIDSGAAFGGYGADITRAVPADGHFSPRQREIYDIVLQALEAATAAVRPGRRIAEVDKVARAVITRAGHGDAFIHGIGHHLGLETHDDAPDAPLRAGNVITIEPGIYLPDEKIGIRLEDDVLVTKDGRENLSKKIPRDAKAIEKLMKR